MLWQATQNLCLRKEGVIVSRLMTTKPERRPRFRPGLALLLATLAQLRRLHGE